MAGSFLKTDTEGRTRYRVEDGVHCVDIYLTNILQLFDRRDPSPFREKDLDEDFVKYLDLSVRELAKADDIKIVLKMPEHNPLYLRVNDIEEALYNFYAFEVEAAENDLEELFRQGRWSFLMGVGFVVLCHTVAAFLPNDISPLVSAFREGLNVLSWVALWRPLNIFLYDWWPILERIRLLRRQAQLKVEIITG